MDIYDFLDPIIAEHCRETEHVFTSLEMAVIIHRSNKPVTQKHNAYTQIIEGYPDMPVPELIMNADIPENNYEEKPSLHEVLRVIINCERKAIADFMKPQENTFYLVLLLDYGDEHDPFSMRELGTALFSTIEEAKDAFEQMLSGPFGDEASFISVRKINLNDTEIYYKNGFVHFNLDGEMSSVYAGYDLRCDTFDNHYYHLCRLYYDLIRDIKAQIPKIKRLTDKALQDVVTATENFDFDSVTDLELYQPKTLSDLTLFPNLKRLIISSPKRLNLFILNDADIETLHFLSGLQEIILKLEPTKEAQP
jgi:hypothetical protein